MDDHGITVSPTPITAGERVEIQYNGLLSRSGAQEVYLHAGFGLDNQWENIMDIKMHKEGMSWKADCAVKTDKRFYFCFHDNADNWDNNSGTNWSFEVHNGKLY
ncbi:MAG: carbohydrate-binding protein [Halanaerobiales bacterium]